MLTTELSKEVRGARMRFLDVIEPHRKDLHRYCRSLTGDPWDAEDLVQETLLRAFAKLGEIHAEIEKPRSYLLRMATNAWIDKKRRSEEAALPEGWDGEESPPLGPEVREALLAVASHLPPQERAALLLKDVFGLSLEETAGALDTTQGAVKAALHRGRARLEALPREEVSTVSREVPEALLDAFVDAFNARDLDRLTGLLLEDATAEVVGMVQEYGRKQIRDGSLHHTLFDEEGQPRAERVLVSGESLIVIWDGPTEKARVGDVLRFTTEEGRVRTLRYYYFCPETLEEIAGKRLGLPVQTNGYRYTPS